jgi:hypothetical protein
MDTLSENKQPTPHTENSKHIQPKAKKSPDKPKTKKQAAIQLLRSPQGASLAELQNRLSWQGRCFASLSQIAHEITGARWSGPRFFGIKDCSPAEAPPNGETS